MQELMVMNRNQMPERDPGLQRTKGEREGDSKSQGKGSLLADH